MLRASRMQNWTRGLLMASVAALGWGIWASPARADILVNPNGGGTVGALPVGQINFNPGNVQNIGAVTAIGTANTAPSGTAVTTAPFEVLVQASVGTLSSSGGITQFAPGVGGTNNITAVAFFNETASFISNGTGSALFPATITLTTTPSVLPNQIEFYSHATGQSNLAGTGFRDGVEIMKATIASGNGAYGNTQPQPPFPPLDNNNNGNQYPGVTSVTGAGGTTENAVVTSFAANYFPDLMVGAAVTLNFNNSLIDPYNQADPSAAFYTVPDVGPIGSAAGRPTNGGTAPTAGTGVPSVGSINGVSGPNFMQQLQATASIQQAVAVPEPGTFALALTGIGIASLAGIRAARQRRTE